MSSSKLSHDVDGIRRPDEKHGEKVGLQVTSSSYYRYMCTIREACQRIMRWSRCSEITILADRLQYAIFLCIVNLQFWSPKTFFTPSCL